MKINVHHVGRSCRSSRISFLFFRLHDPSTDISQAFPLRLPKRSLLQTLFFWIEIMFQAQFSHNNISLLFTCSFSSKTNCCRPHKLKHFQGDTISQMKKRERIKFPFSSHISLATSSSSPSALCPLCIFFLYFY